MIDRNESVDETVSPQVVTAPRAARVDIERYAIGPNGRKLGAADLALLADELLNASMALPRLIGREARARWEVGRLLDPIHRAGPIAPTRCGLRRSI